MKHFQLMDDEEMTLKSSVFQILEAETNSWQFETWYNRWQHQW